MPSPIGHSCASLLLYNFAQPKARIGVKPAWWQTPLAAIIIGNLPDLDLAAGWILTGDPTRYHQLFTHNIWLALAVGLVMALCVRQDRILAGTWGFTLIGLHLLLDAGIGPVPGQPPTLGIYVLWPLSNARLGLPVAIVPMLHFGTLDQILTWKNLWTILYEIILFAIPLGFVTWRQHSLQK